MLKSWQTPVGLVIVLAFPLAVYFEPTCWARGKLWGEAFFDGRPTSYWRELLEDDLHTDPNVLYGLAPSAPSYWRRGMDWIGFRPRTESSVRLVANMQAEDVLQDLMRDRNANIAAFAKDVPRRLADTPSEWVWKELICKHNIKFPKLPVKAE